MTPHKVVFLDSGSFYKEFTFESNSQDLEVKLYSHTKKAEINERLKDAEICIANKAPLNRETLNGLRNLKLICLTATGYNNVDIDFCLREGIQVRNAKNYGTTSISEHTMGLILALNRNIPFFQRIISEGGWQKSDHFCVHGNPIRELKGLKLVLYGGGVNGLEVAKLAAAFGMEIFFSERKESNSLRKGYISFQEAIEIGDIHSIHCPLNETTYKLFGLNEFKLMKPEALIINTARGGIIIEDELLYALDNKIIAGAALDVLETEPPIDNGLISEHRDNLIITPHIAWAGINSMKKLWNITMENIHMFLIGKDINRIV